MEREKEEGGRGDEWRKGGREAHKRAVTGIIMMIIMV